MSHAGLALLRQLADRTGLTAGLSRALPSPLCGHDRGRVVSDLACAIADGARVISDFRVMGDQRKLFGPVASVPTAWRSLKEIAGAGDRAQRRLAAAVAAVRPDVSRFDGFGVTWPRIRSQARLPGRRGNRSAEDKRACNPRDFLSWSTTKTPKPSPAAIPTASLRRPRRVAIFGNLSRFGGRGQDLQSRPR